MIGARLGPARLSLVPYLYAVPAVLALGVFIWWPIVYSAWLSVHRWDFLSPAPTYVGLANYAKLVNEERFWNSVTITTWFTVASVPLRLVLALMLAQVLVDETPLRRVLRGAYFLPVISSTVAVSVVWSWLFSTDQGLVNLVLRSMGLGGVRWLTSPDMALWTVVIVSIWKQLGYDIVVYVAGIAAIPKDYYEAARIDGAGPVRQFASITVPLVAPTTLFLLIVAVIDSFQVFTVVNVMTRGGPAGSTEVLVSLLYRTSFAFFDIGKGSAIAMLLFVFLLALTALKFLIARRRVGYDLA
jgi:ABC-type sugar transport system permease subunit